MLNKLSENQIDTAALAKMQSLFPEVIKTIQETVASQKIVVVGMAQNQPVKKARQTLDQKKLEYKYLEYGSYFSQWKLRLAIKLWSGWPTFPQVFIGGKLIGGASELEIYLQANRLN